MRKPILFILLAAILSLFAAGCSGSEKIIYNAFEKLSKASSFETVTQLSLNMKVERAEKNKLDLYNFIMPFFSELRVTSHEKMQKSGDAVKEVQSNNEIDFGGILIKYDTWSSQIKEGKKTSTSSVIKIPPLFTNFFPEEFRGKRYIVFDEKQLNDTIKEKAGPNVNRDGIQEAADNFNKSLLNIIEKDTTLFSNMGFSLIQRTGVKTNNGTEYSAVINDEQLKTLLKYLINRFGKEKEFMDSIRTFVKSISQYTSAINGTSAGLNEIDAFFNSGLHVKYANAVIDSLKDIQLLGDKGIQMKFYINDDKGVVEEDYYYDLRFNPAKVSEAVGKAMLSTISGNAGSKNMGTPNYRNQEKDENSEIYSIQIGYTIHRTNFNVPLNIELPETNEGNSFSYADLIKLQLEEKKRMLEEQKLLEDKQILMRAGQSRGYVNSKNIILFNDKIVPSTTAFLQKDGVTFIPVISLGKLTGAEVTYDKSSNTVVFAKNGNVIKIRPESSKATVNGVEKDMGEVAPVLSGRLIVPLKFICEAIGGSISYDPVSRTVNVLIK